MGHNDSDDMKQRLIPKLTPENGARDKKKDDDDTEEDRTARINATKVTVSDFFTKCIDYDMLKIFFGSMLGFFFAVFIVTILYLICIYFFKESMWHYYFPRSRVYHSEL